MMTKVLVGRAPEQKELSEMLRSKVAEFMVLYGRRRIGKSYLIEMYFRKKACIFFHVTGIKNGTLKEQLAEFAKAIGGTFYNGATIASSQTWMSAFEELTRAINTIEGGKKVVLFIDELPWLCTKRSRLIQSIDFYWNKHWKNNKKIKLIVCGSSASWIIRKIIHNKGGLHNRNTRTILLKPFNLYETKLFLQVSGIKLSHDQIVQIYMFCGGVPYYLNYLSKGKSAAQQIDKMCFQETGILHDEFDKLFDSLFDDSDIYKELVRVISKSREGVGRSSIEKNSSMVSRGGRLTERLKDLEDAAFIQSFTPLGHRRQGIYYRISDEYCYFYLKWIEPAKNTLLVKERDNKYWSSRASSPEHFNWMGYAFESICYKQIYEIRQALGINVGAIPGVWRYSPRKNSVEDGAQIDLVFDRDDGVTTLCEIKYTNKKFAIDKSYSQRLLRKLEVYKERTRTQKELNLAFVSARGLVDNKYAHELVHSVAVLDDLFKSD